MASWETKVTEILEKAGDSVVGQHMLILQRLPLRLESSAFNVRDFTRENVDLEPEFWFSTGNSYQNTRELIPKLTCCMFFVPENITVYQVW